MITDRLENIQQYQSLFSGIDQFVKVSQSKSLNAITAKETHGEITLIPISSQAVSETFDPSVLEAHKTLMDIHITLEGTDVIAYADLESETTSFKAYDEVNDYLLAQSDAIKTISVPEGYFCIIPNNFAHMALYEGHANVKKVVVKMNAVV
ncbi:YhcH/YjgK/YiaL family protein [Flavobacterium sp.]|uniref:YhcH/YjgK/YiaL family protein n=1 Tax=Flavobacterium sp. TaxID=239 RepID=UPI00391D8A32